MWTGPSWAGPACRRSSSWPSSGPRRVNSSSPERLTAYNDGLPAASARLSTQGKGVAVRGAELILADGWLPPVLNTLILVIGIFLILLILIQRGKGGGLSGAFGGTGGSSAFGSRAGDRFTRITIYVAAFWILLTMFMVRVVQDPSKKVESETVMPVNSEP